MRRNLNKTVAYFKNLLIHVYWVLETCAVVPSAVAEIRGLPDSKAPSAVEVEMGAQEFLKINTAQSKASCQCLSKNRRSNTEALQYKRQIQCNRITNDNQNINEINEKHVINYRSPQGPEDGRSQRSSMESRR